MARCDRCGGSYPDSSLTVVLDVQEYGIGKSEMCPSCVRHFMQGRSGLMLRPSGRQQSQGKWWQFWK